MLPAQSGRLLQIVLHDTSGLCESVTAGSLARARVTRVLNKITINEELAYDDEMR